MISRRFFATVAWMFLYLTTVVAARSAFEMTVSPRRDPCPPRCGATGLDPSNWPAYYSFDKLSQCDRTVLLDFAIQSELDDFDQAQTMKFRSCSIWGGDFSAMNKSPTFQVKSSTPANVTLQNASFGDKVGAVQTADAISAGRAPRKYLGATSTGQDTTILFSI
ncbi:hypothetical protein AJ79_06359 [Helicocarpus griseus UAMH5409]|uniref:Uncharacterized protein n=1 Tax=Helicocarpus griseus UAMH5409 TaxID=1447875 RepID=A0A2B7XE90_9EURO|nr:hypothetical protein AJ79_06359 [Helicocarpus griseus UAMH5409]